MELIIYDGTDIPLHFEGDDAKRIKKELDEAILSNKAWVHDVPAQDGSLVSVNLNTILGFRLLPEID